MQECEQLDDLQVRAKLPPKVQSMMAHSCPVRRPVVTVPSNPELIADLTDERPVDR